MQAFLICGLKKPQGNVLAHKLFKFQSTHTFAGKGSDNH